MPDPTLNPILASAGARFADVSGHSTPLDYGDPLAEYTAARTRAAIYAATDRGLIELRGRDRAPWLHNLTTNAVKTLAPGQGNYAFAINLKGRILFDLDVLALADAFWLDLDARLVAKALAHFDKYTIAEDVHCRDCTADFTRIALCGPAAVEIADALGAANVASMPQLSSLPVPLCGRHRLLVRHDFAGIFGAELYIDTADAAQCRTRLLEIGQPVGLRPAGWQALDTLRIESGLPRYGQDITEDTLPAETGQSARAVSYTKGCYLGQEVVERMRSRGAVANQLVGLRLTARLAAPPAIPSPLTSAGAEVGRLTSICHSPALNSWIGLATVRSSHAAPGTRLLLLADPPLDVEVVSLPFPGES